MNSCWSPVFWCNNGGTLLSHPPPPSPISPYIASYLSILWIPVEVPYFDVTMVELRSLIPPPSPISPYIASYLSVLWIPVEVPYFDVTMVELRSLTPPPFALICFIFVSILWILVEVPYFDVTMVELHSLIPPPPPIHPTMLHICQFYEFLLKSRILM